MCAAAEVGNSITRLPGTGDVGDSYYVGFPDYVEVYIVSNIKLVDLQLHQ